MMQAIVSLPDVRYLLIAILAVAVAVLLVQQHRQKQDGARLREAFDAVARATDEGVLELDARGRVTNCNTGAVRLLGAEVLRPLWDIRTLSEEPTFSAAIDALLQGERTEITLKLGKKPCRLTGQPLCNGKRVMGATVILFDVTERDGGEKMRREFTANVSHELKTPLTSISGFAEIIKDGIAKKDDVQHFAENIYNESQRLIHLVEDIIKLSRLDENTAPVEREPVEMGQLIHTTLEHLRTLCEKKQVTLETKVEPVTVYGAPHILDEIVFNLCENAVKYNRPGGRVLVTMTTDSGKPLFRVADTGIGIPPADCERVFERFYRVDKSHSRAIGGTGLGLSIVKHGVQFHDGTITLESEPDVGTTVTVRFPAAPQ
ncbi:MAG: hypothetical protein IKA63_06665 [Clostridia bacterium]|nr:hypothetical protein [Clostridia bacterium]